MTDVATFAKLGAQQERARIRKAQAGAIKNLRGLLEITDCLQEIEEEPLTGCGTGDKRRTKHAQDCAYGCLLADIRALEAATREPSR